MRFGPLRKLCEIQLCALFFAVPFEYFLRSRDQSLLTSLKIQVFCLIFVWGASKVADSMRHGDFWRNLRSVLPKRIVLTMMSFVAVQVLAAALAPEYRNNALKAAVKTAVGAVLALAAADISLGLQSVKAHSSRTNYVSALSISGLSMALLGLGEFAGIGLCSRLVGLFQTAKYFVGDSVRFVSTMEYPNTAASFLSVALCATVSLAVTRRPKRRAGIWYAISVASVVVLGSGLSLTYSRGAIGAAIIAIGIVCWIWRRHFEVRHAALVLTACFVVLLTAAWSSYSVRRQPVSHAVPAPSRIAEYGLTADAQTKTLRPDQMYTETIAVRNVSSFGWPRVESGIAYRWHDVSEKRNSPLELGAIFPTDIAPGQGARVDVSINTPTKEGEYVLIWFVARRNGGIHELKDAYSPGILCVITSAKTESVTRLSLQAQGYVGAISEERRELKKLRVPGRWELWSAATRIFLRHPLLGLGPDSFRLVKWQYMDIAKGDETILANSLYLELLSGSGGLGLLSFLWLLWECWRVVMLRNSRKNIIFVIDATAFFGTTYLILLMVHGFVDYFLKFTPTFLMFWLIIGVLCANKQPSGERWE